MRILTLPVFLIALCLGTAQAEPQITEFLAINTSSLTDGDSKTPDWIEIHNPDPAPFDLTGYQLTNDVKIPSKYTFPENTSIPGGGYLVVFASNRAEPNGMDAAGNLHTNFSLSGNGDYLAFHAPDGGVIQAFEPAFDPQFEDISYGIGTSQTRTTLIAPGASASWLVPDADIGTDWQLPGYDDTSWTPTTTGIGYGHDALIGAGGDTRGGMWFGNASVYLRIPFDVEDPSNVTSIALDMAFDDGFVAYVNGTRIAAANAPDEAALTHTSTATAERPESEVTSAETFAIPPDVLRADGNVLAIHGLNFSASGANSADFLALPELTATASSASGSFGYFTEPSPGEPNLGTLLLGFVADTKFSHDRGYHSEPFDLTITSKTPGATIRYTTDGTPPSEENGDTYTAPIPITATTTLRAVAIKDGYQATNIDTQTFLFVEDIVRQTRPRGYPVTWGGGPADYDMDPDIVDHPDYADTFHDAFAALPTLSLVFDPDALFDSSTGIYQRPSSEGRAWERPLSAEFFVSDGSEPGFHINAGIRLQGGSSRSTDTPKHSLSLRFRAEYGDAKLRYPLFENTASGNTSVEKFDLLQLRPEYNFGWMHRHHYQAVHALYGRDQWTSDLFNAMGQNGSHGRWAHLFLNGIYWGLYDIHERPDSAHMANYFGGTDDDYDTVNSSVATAGDLVAYNAMMNLAYGDIEEDATYEAIQEYLNIDAFIDYMILNAYVGNRDWDGHNWRAARKREPGAGYLFFPWDTEMAAAHVSGGAFDPAPEFFDTTLNTDVTRNNGSRRPTGLQTRLQRNAKYRLRYADRVHAHFFNGGPLTPAKAAELWTARSASMRLAIVAESARWGDFRRDVLPGRWRREQFDLYTRDDHYLPLHAWFIETYIPQRADIVLEQLRGLNLYPKITAPAFSQHGGPVASGFQLQVTGNTLVRYTTDGSDPRLPGGGVNPNAQSIAPGTSLTLTESMRIKARSRSIFGEWSALTEAHFSVGTSDLRLSEIMYHPQNAPLAEFLELHNSGTGTVSLAGLQFSKGIIFDFDAHTSIQTLAPGERLLIVRDLLAFRAVYGNTHDAIIAGSFQDNTGLSNSGETLTLTDGNDATVLTLTYNDKTPWPTSADGDGRSLLFTGDDPANPSSWKASADLGGSPGIAGEAVTLPNGPFATSLVISRTADGIRLTYNTTEQGSIAVQQSADLSAWEEIQPNLVNDQLDPANGTRTVTLQLPPATDGFVRLVLE